jgi:hypothetical protein
MTLAAAAKKLTDDKTTGLAFSPEIAQVGAFFPGGRLLRQ